MKYLALNLWLIFIETKEYIQERTMRYLSYAIKLIKIQILLKYIYFLFIHLHQIHY